MANYNIPEEFINDEKISKLATEIARTFMSNKANFATEDFINTYLDIYETALKIIYNRQVKKVNQDYNSNELDNNKKRRI